MTDLSLDPREDERLDEVNEQISLLQKKNGLTFGTDAYLLAAFLRPAPQKRAVELGAGTGIVSLLVAARGKVRDVVAVELQEEYAELSARNFARNGFSDRLRAVCADVRDLSPKDLGYECDVVLSNPPYMRTDSGLPNRNAGKNTARHETAGGIADFASAASRLLKHGGVFLTVYRPDRLADLMDALRSASLEPKRMTFVAADAHTAPSIVLVESKKGAAAGLTLTPTLLLYREPAGSGPREMTPEALAVYDTCALSYAENAGKKPKGTAAAPSAPLQKES